MFSRNFRINLYRVTNEHKKRNNYKTQSRFNIHRLLDCVKRMFWLNADPRSNPADRLSQRRCDPIRIWFELIFVTGFDNISCW
jgi:hypothetical protein